MSPGAKQEIDQYLTNKCRGITLMHNPCGNWQQERVLHSEVDCNDL
jgi:hypothetical protein